MDRSPGPNRRFRWLLGGMIVVGAIYASYVANQYFRISRLNQQELSNVGVEYKRAIENAVGTVNRFKHELGRPNDSRLTTWTPPAVKPLCSFDWDQPYLTLDGSCQTKATQILPDAPTADFDEYDKDARQSRRVSKSIPLERFTWDQIDEWLSDAELTTDGVIAIELELLKGGRDPKPAPIRFLFGTDVLAKELAVPDLFTLVFVADASGKVVFQDTPSARRWSRHLQWQEREFRDSGAGRYGGLRISHLSEIVKGPDGKPPGTIGSMTSQTTVEIAGEAHKVYLQPLTLENGHTVNLIVGAVVARDDMLRQALAVDTYFLAALVFLVFLGVLGFPFVKLATLDKHERFTRRDLGMLCLSTTALLALMTFATLGIDGYLRWRHQADRGLQSSAERLHTLFVSEVTQIRDQLQRYDDSLSRQPARACEPWPVYTNWLTARPRALNDGGQESESPLFPDTLPLPAAPVRFEQVAWIGADGWQIWKDTADPVGQKVNVVERPYFRAVRDEGLLQIGQGTRPFFLLPDRSITDGKSYTFISIPSSLPAPSSASDGFCTDSEVREGSFVAAATTQILSLDHPPMPAGYGFALVNRDGRVLYHSDTRLALRENLFEELGDGARVRAMIYAGRAGVIRSRYRERPFAFYVEPLSDIVAAGAKSSHTSLDIVTFRDVSIEQFIVSKVFLLGLLGPILFFVIAGRVVVWIIGRLAPGGRRSWSSWLCARHDLEPLCRKVSAATALLLLAGVGFYAAGGGDLIFFSMPLVATLGTISLLATTSPGRDDVKPARSYWHTATIVLLLVAIVIAPAASVFHVALTHEFGKLIRTEQKWMDAQRADVLQMQRANARTLQYSAEIGQSFAAARANYLPDNPAPFNAVPQPTPVTTGWFLPMFHWVDEVLPMENEDASRQHYEDDDTSYSPEGTWPIIGVTTAAVAGLTFTILLLAFWVSWGTSRLFLAGSDMPAAKPPHDDFEPTWKELPEDERFALLQIAREHVANPYQQKAVRNLLCRGLLRHGPDLRPSSEALVAFLKTKEREVADDFRKWEEQGAGASWHYVRLMVIGSVSVLALFLLTTQPGLQTQMVGIAVGVTGLLQTFAKLRDAVAAWFDRRSKAAA